LILNLIPVRYISRCFINFHEVRGTSSLSFRNKYILEPAYCPIIKDGTVKRRVIISKPVPAANRNKMIKATGICIASKNCKENFRTFTRQYPKGIFMISTKRDRKTIFIMQQNIKFDYTIQRNAGHQSCAGF
jgi:hypothetical protein